MKILDTRSIGSSRSGSRVGFTRIDLTITVAVLMVLAVLNLAAVRSGAVSSRGGVCMSNLRVLTRAIQQYAMDEGRLPPSPDNGNTTPGYNWAPGQAGPGGAQQFNSDILRDKTRSLLVPYIKESGANPFHCPSDLRTGIYQGTNPAMRNVVVPAARSYSMNGAIGTDPYTPGGILAVDGPWLNNDHTHIRGLAFRTYGSLNDIVDPAPGRLSILFDEDPDSINDGTYSFGMVRAEWIDWVATRHEMSSPLSFADGHVEMHHWREATTPVINGRVMRLSVPGSVDYLWLRERISAPIRR